MSTEHLNDNEIEKLALEHVYKKVQYMDSHINQCENCLKKYNYFKGFYSKLDNEMVNPIHQDIDTLAEQSFELTQHELLFYQPRYDESIYNIENGSTVLAAKSHDKLINRFTKQAVYSDNAGDMLVRILKDNTSQRYLLFMVNDSVNPLIAELICCEGKIIGLGTVEHHKLEFELDEEIEWEKSKIILKEINPT